MKCILMSLITLLMFVFPFQLVAQAETSDLHEFKQYESFQKRYYEHATDLVYFSSNAYLENQHYFKENMQLWRDAVNNAFELDEDGFVNSMLDSSEYLFERPVALLSTLPDLRKYLFEKIKSFFGKDEYVEFSSFNVPEGYYLSVAGECTNTPNGCIDRQFITVQPPTRDNVYSEVHFRLLSLDGTFSVTTYFSFRNANATQMQYVTDLFTKVSNGDFSLTDLFKTQDMFPAETWNIQLKRIDDGVVDPYKNPVYSEPIDNVFNNIINNYNPQNLEGLQGYIPTVQPQLVCPNQVVSLQYEEGIFKTLSGDLVTINESEQANYLESLCNLDFSFPEIYFHDDTGKLLVGGVDYSSTTLPVAPIDNSLVAYIRNSYEYATTVINSGVNGLKSIIAGTAALVTFTGSLFAFLPPELLTLFIGGFSVALGLWVFKK